MNHVDRGDQLRSYTSYEHRFRRGPWQALLWSFLLDIALANSFILQLKTTSPNWKPYTTLKDWKKCIYNAIFIAYAQESGERKGIGQGKKRTSRIQKHTKNTYKERSTGSGEASNPIA